MTENKRFQIIHLGNPYDFVVKDHNTNKTYGTLQGDDKSLMELLNELHDENKQLKLQYSGLKITLMNNQLAYNDLNDENTHIKNTITEMYNNERTMIGKSTLKQLLEAIQ